MPSSNERRRARAGLLAVALWISGATAQAQIDQRNDAAPPNLFNSIPELGPLGQEFVPTHSALGFVDLFTQDFDDRDGLSAVVFVQVRRDTIAGPVVGTSLPALLPNGFNDVTRFQFPELVPLLPGSVHVLEAVLASGENWSVGRTDVLSLDTYPAGRPITLGEPEADGTADLWFREGVSEIPEPSTPLLLSAAGLASLASRRRSGPKNPGVQHAEDQES